MPQKSRNPGAVWPLYLRAKLLRCTGVSMRYSPKGDAMGDASSGLPGVGDVPRERAGCDAARLPQPRWAQVNWWPGRCWDSHSCRGWWGAGLAPAQGFLGLGSVGAELRRGFCVLLESAVKVWYLFLFSSLAGLVCCCCSGCWSRSCPRGWVSTGLLCAGGTGRAGCLGMVCRCRCENEQCLCFKRKKKKSSKGFKY